MKRKIIEINEERCSGCGACAKACHEGSIAMVNGKAKLIRDDYCDGLGDCLPACPANAIHFVEREAEAYNADAVAAHKAERHVCSGTMAKAMQPGAEKSIPRHPDSQLSQWPVQIKLINPNAAYLDGAKLLVAADCTAYAYANFHEDFIKGRITLVGCPKLDSVDYSVKLTEILKNHNIRDVLVVRMEVPCCGGLEYAAKNALQNCGKMIPWRVVTISTEGNILE